MIFINNLENLDWLYAYVKGFGFTESNVDWTHPSMTKNIYEYTRCMTQTPSINLRRAERKIAKWM